MDDKYDHTKLIQFKQTPFWMKWFFRLTVPFMIPVILFKSAKRKLDRNILHDGKRHLTGVKKVALGAKHDFNAIKATSKALKVTINELCTASLSVAIKQLFEDRDDTKTEKIQIACPVNIRWKPYESFEAVKLENKFAPLSI